MIRLEIIVNLKEFNYYANLANSKKEFNQLVEAVVSYEKAIALKPKFAEAYANIDNVYMKMYRRYQEELALEEFEIQVSI